MSVMATYSPQFGRVHFTHGLSSDGGRLDELDPDAVGGLGGSKGAFEFELEAASLITNGESSVWCSSMCSCMAYPLLPVNPQKGQEIASSAILELKYGLAVG
jgi:hypothetical protein